MAEFITGFETAEGVKKYDYNSLANKPEDGTGTIISGNADYAEVGEWSDGNPNSEDRLGYFVAIAAVGDNTIKIRKATSEDDVKGVTVLNPAFSGNAAAEKYVSDGVLYPKYSYVGLMGIVSVIDNGTCTVGGRCMPANDGTAIPSTNNMGYGVLERIDENHVLIAVEPGADMIQRIKTQIVELQNRQSGGGDGDGASDWSQHDANGKGYINSRPFYEVKSGDAIYKNTDLQLQGEGGGATEAWLPNRIDLIEGERYYVFWGEKLYEITATRDSNSPTVLVLKREGDFLIRTAESGLMYDDNKTNIISYNGLTSVSLMIATTRATIKKIDKKFLPDDIGGGTIDPTRIPDMYYEEEVELLPETSLTFFENDGTQMALIEGVTITFENGQTYKIIYNGTEYICVYDETIGLLGNTGLLAGGESTGEPFIIGSGDADVVVMSIMGDTSATLSIIGNVVHGMNKKFLPEELKTPTISEWIFDFTEGYQYITDTTTHYTSLKKYKDRDRVSVWSNVNGTTRTVIFQRTEYDPQTQKYGFSATINYNQTLILLNISFFAHERSGGYDLYMKTLS